MSRALKIRLFLTITAAALAVGLVTVAAAAPPPAPLQDTASDICAKITGYWSLEETSSTRFDETANDLDLTDNNTVGYTTGQQGNAADFEVDNTEYLSRANQALLQGGDTTYGLYGWLKAESLPSARAVVSKDGYPTAGWRDYMLYYSTSINAFYFVAFTATDTGQQVAASSYGSLSLDTWAFVSAWHRADQDTLYISVDDGTVNTQAYTGPLQSAGNAAFALGDRPSSSIPWDGVLDEWAWTQGDYLTAAEITWLYNSGSGRAYDDICTGGATATPTATITNTPDPAATATPDPVEIRGTLPSSGADYVIRREASFGQMFSGVAVMAVALILLVLLFIQVIGRTL